MKLQRFWIWMVGFVLLAAIGGGVWWFAGNTIATKAEIRRLTTLFEQDPQNYDAAFNLGVQYYRLRQYNKAADYYNKAIAIRPDYTLAHNNLGNTYRESLRYEEAEVAYRAAIAAQPEYISPYLNLANLLEIWPKDENTDRSTEVPALLDEGLKATKNDPTLLQTVIDYYRRNNSQAKASEYQKILDEL